MKGAGGMAKPPDKTLVGRAGKWFKEGYALFEPSLLQACGECLHASLGAFAIVPRQPDSPMTATKERA
jgi:hypothetical protein